jgi:lysophospholipase L1-like esterase
VPKAVRPRAVLFNAGLACASLALTAGALELAARWAERRPGEPLAQPDPLLGWRHRAGATLKNPNGDYRINTMGLRDRERTYRAAPGTQRVMVLGDSFAEGFSVRLEDALPQALERALAARGCPAEVLNAGTVGYSTDQEYLFYREEGSRYRPQVVALLLYYNDVLYNARGSVGVTPKPLFTFAGGVPRVKNTPLPSVAPFAPAPRARARGSAGVRWLRGRLASAWPSLYDALARLRFWSPLPRGDTPLELQVYARHPPSEMERAWEYTGHLLRLLREEVERSGARLLLVYVPTKMEVSDRDWQVTRRRYGVDDTVWDRRRLATLLSQAGARSGFPVLDPTAELRAADHGFWGGPYHAGGGHWNALGHKVVSERLADFLTREAWVSCR